MPAVSWVAAHREGTRLDTSLNYDMVDADLRDQQLLGAMSSARLSSAISEDVWVVSHVFNGEVSEVSAFCGGYRIRP